MDCNLSTEARIAFVAGIILCVLMGTVWCDPAFAGGPAPSVPTTAEVDADLGLKADLAGGNTFSGFNSFGTGNTAIKIKTVTGTTGGAEGASTTIAHGLTYSNIVGFVVQVQSSSNILTQANQTGAGFQFSTSVDGTNVNVVLHATESENILNAAITVIIFYKE